MPALPQLIWQNTCRVCCFKMRRLLELHNYHKKETHSLPHLASWPNLASSLAIIAWMETVCSFLLVIFPLKHSAPGGINLECIVDVWYKWKYVIEFCRALVICFVVAVGKMKKISKLFQSCNTQILEQIFIFLRILLESELLRN